MTEIVLSKQELAQAFKVSLNTVGNWTLQGLPRRKCGRAGAASEYVWSDCAQWLIYEKFWRFGAWKFDDPEVIVARAYERALALVKARARR